MVVSERQASQKCEDLERRGSQLPPRQSPAEHVDVDLMLDLVCLNVYVGSPSPPCLSPQKQWWVFMIPESGGKVLNLDMAHLFKISGCPISLG